MIFPKISWWWVVSTTFDGIISSGWWFGTFFIFPYIGKNNPNWPIFFRGVGIPPTSHGWCFLRLWPLWHQPTVGQRWLARRYFCTGVWRGVEPRFRKWLGRHLRTTNWWLESGWEHTTTANGTLFTVYKLPTFIIHSHQWVWIWFLATYRFMWDSPTINHLGMVGIPPIKMVIWGMVWSWI